MAYRKLNRPSDQRNAMLRSLTTALLWNGRVVTTEARAKEVRSVAEKLITMAGKEYKNTIEVEKRIKDASGNMVAQNVRNDLPSKLHARRYFLSYLYEVKDAQGYDESKADYKERLKGQPNHPVIEKLFEELGPKYETRPGGYTRITKMGPRRGDAAEMVVLELV